MVYVHVFYTIYIKYTVFAHNLSFFFYCGVLYTFCSMLYKIYCINMFVINDAQFSKRIYIIIVVKLHVIEALGLLTTFRKEI